MATLGSDAPQGGVSSPRSLDIRISQQYKVLIKLNPRKRAAYPTSTCSLLPQTRR